MKLINYVAKVVSETNEFEDDASLEERVETARLIAAAPELLSACRATLSDVLYDEESEHTLCYSTLQLLKNAIAKAEGEEK